MKHWLKAFRLRTLPLALSSIVMGSFLSADAGKFSWLVCSLCVGTTIFLQILSNLANDYGDYKHGADSDERIGPVRAMQSGAITTKSMKRAIWIFVILSLVTGISLLLVAFGPQKLLHATYFFALGIAAIWAALNYTSGRNPYGYRALGDLFVLIFFGWIGVCGTYFLFTNDFNVHILLPATAIGLMAVGVLNINNTRDIESDKNAGKMTIAVLLGARNARVYQAILIDTSLVLLVLHTFLNFRSYIQLSYLIALPVYFFIAWNVMKKPAEELDPYLRQMALSSLLTSVLFGLGLLLA